jgi:hypothetical protein
MPSALLVICTLTNIVSEAKPERAEATKCDSAVVVDFGDERRKRAGWVFVVSGSVVMDNATYGWLL